MDIATLVGYLLPRRPTTEARAIEAMESCGISPDAIAWQVAVDGAFAFGRKSPDDDGLSDDQFACLLEWTRKERVKTGFIGWVQGES